MNLLALDTSSLACAVGLAAGDARHLRYAEEAREHTRLLLPMIREVLADGGLAPADLDAIVLGNGPGSFIGLRIAASVAAGLGYAAGRPIVPVSSMAAVAMQAGAPGDTVAVTQDAHMNQVYLGIYRLDERGVAAPVVEERLQPVAAVPELSGQAVIAAGAGWERYPALLDANRGDIRVLSDVRYPAAAALLDLGALAFAAGATVGPDAIRPAYLRHEVAAAPRATP